MATKKTTAALNDVNEVNNEPGGTEAVEQEQSLPALDPVIEKQVSQLSKATAEKLCRARSAVVKIPLSKNKADDYVVVGINGWNFQIRRGIPVRLPEPVIDLLEQAGYMPMRVRG